MPTDKLKSKQASARRKATESAGAVSTGHGASLVTKIPHIGSFIPADNVIKSGEDHAYRGIRMRQKQKMLEKELGNRNERPSPYEQSDRSAAFRRGVDKALGGDAPRRL